MIKTVYRLLLSFGFDPRQTIRAIRGIGPFIGDAIRYSRSTTDRSFPIKGRFLYACLADRYDDAGTAKGHYFHQDLWAARRIFENRPESHVDVGSRVDGFIAHLLVFMPVTVLDVRPQSSKIEGLSFKMGDACGMDPFGENSLASISCLHAAEHFGLGRYGDPIDASSHLDLMHSLARVLKPKGKLYFGVPVGKQRLEFNAHRVYDPMTIVDAMEGLDLVEFSMVDDAGDLHRNVDPKAAQSLNFGCGLFEFTKS